VDEAVIKYYRRLLKTSFEHAGSFENASIFVEAIGEKMIDCGNTGNYMQLYITVVDNTISDIKYLCSCEPTANVAVEVLCTLVKGKILDEAAGLTEQAFYQFLGSEGEELRTKVRGVLELLNEGITRYKTPVLLPRRRPSSTPSMQPRESGSKTFPPHRSKSGGCCTPEIKS
jgi:NifU-like protein involved in Fe-S cluster formation